MAWSNSMISRQAVADMLTNAAAFQFTSDTWKIALYNNSITPDKDVVAAAFAYNAGVWAIANEQSAANWPAGGVTLAGKTLTTPSTGVIMADATDPVSTGTTTLANVYGGLVYDDSLTSPVADQALAALYMGGANSVTAGVFNVLLAANGILRITV